MRPAITETLLHDLLNDFLEGQENYLELSEKDKKESFTLYKNILTTVYDTINIPDANGIIFAKDTKSKKVICEAMNNLRSIVPEVDSISVSVVN